MSVPNSSCWHGWSHLGVLQNTLPVWYKTAMAKALAEEVPTVPSPVQSCLYHFLLIWNLWKLQTPHALEVLLSNYPHLPFGLFLCYMNLKQLLFQHSKCCIQESKFSTCCSLIACRNSKYHTVPAHHATKELGKIITSAIQCRRVTPSLP